MAQESFEQVVIQVPSRISNDFKRKAKKSFPNEAFAYLLGHKLDGKIIIDDLFYPDNVDQFCGRDYVNVQDNWIREAKKYAKQINAVIVGDIHSHPHNNKQTKIYNLDTAPSEQDWNALQTGHIMAICLVTECKDGKLRARTRFWAPVAEVKIKETK